MTSPSIDELRTIYRVMLVSRLFDEACAARLASGERLPHYHSGVGQEALMVASVAPLRPEDQIVYTHRGYGHLLMKGIPLTSIVKDLFMKAGGTNHGLGGIMHVNDPRLGVPGREGVFGTRFGIAAGLGLAAQLLAEQSVVVCFYGEAAGARGPLYEALNMCRLWNLPVVFVAENNGWSFTSRTEWLFPTPHMTDAWRSFLPVTVVDGNDVEAVYAAVGTAVDVARSGGGPSMVEGLTYRLAPHIWFDEAAYQPADELAKRRRQDPLPRIEKRLLEIGDSPTSQSALRVEAAQVVSDAFAEGEAAPEASWADVSPWMSR